MKKGFTCLLIAVMLFCFTGCGGQSGSATDINLVADDVLSPMAVYTMATNIFQSPAAYLGKTVQAEGALVKNTDGKTGYWIEIADNTGCCFQPFEFELTDKSLTYPEADSIILITGTFTTYEKDGKNYLIIAADTIEDRDYLFE
jgi:hypothetical protein